MNHILVLACLLFWNAQARLVAGELPLFYDKEDTSAGRAEPALPEFSALPSIRIWPDPFTKSRWQPHHHPGGVRTRRAEIKAMLEHYDAGKKPGKPSIFKATLEGKHDLHHRGRRDQYLQT